MGIFDTSTSSLDPGLMGLSAALLNAGGIQPHPVTLGQALAQGIQGGYTGQDQAIAQQTAQQQLLKAKLDNQITAQVGLPARLSYLQQAQQLIGGPPQMQPQQAQQPSPVAQAAPLGIPTPNPAAQSSATLNPDLMGAINNDQLNGPMPPIPGGVPNAPMNPLQMQQGVQQMQGGNTPLAPPSNTSPQPYPGAAGTNQTQAISPQMALGQDMLNRATGGNGAPEFMKAAFPENGIGTSLNGSQFLLPGRADAEAQKAAEVEAAKAPIAVQTDAAKAAAVNQVNAGKPQTPAEKMQNQLTLASHFQESPQVKDYYENAKNYKSVLEASKGRDKSSDINLIDGVVKMFNPGATVRQGSFNNFMEHSQGLPENIVGTVQSYFGNGQHLSPETRAQLVTQATQRMDSSRTVYNQLANTAKYTADKNGLDPQSVVPQFIDPLTADELARSRGIGPYAKVKQ